MTGHTLTIILDCDRLTTRVICHEAMGAQCRLICVKPGCDWEDGIPHKDEDGTEHPVGDGGGCSICHWMNEETDLIFEWHEDVDEPLTDGMPIVCTWDGDGYTWRGADTVITVITGKRTDITSARIPDLTEAEATAFTKAARE